MAGIAKYVATSLISWRRRQRKCKYIKYLHILESTLKKTGKGLTSEVPALR